MAVESVNSSAGTHNSQGDRAVSVDLSIAVEGVTSRRQEQRPSRPGRPTANHQGRLLRQGEAGEDRRGRDRGISSVGDVDQLQGSRQLDHILVSGELLFTVTRLLTTART
jgi:hypothetical protein